MIRYLVVTVLLAVNVLGVNHILRLGAIIFLRVGVGHFGLARLIILLLIVGLIVLIFVLLAFLLFVVIAFFGIGQLIAHFKVAQYILDRLAVFFLVVN